MKSNYSLEYYFDTLKKSNQELSGLIDLEKINSNIKQVESNLNALNYLICSSVNELLSRIKFLFKNNKKVFESIYILAAIRFEKETKFIINGDVIDQDWLLSSEENLISFVFESRIAEILTNGYVKNLVDYVFGIEVGMDTNARKNRNGTRVEEMVYEKLIEIFKSNSEIKVEKQVFIEGIKKNKKLDFVISNTKTNKKVIVESSFYNSGGSKISETARSYDSLNKLINSLNTKDFIFIWLADGIGMSTIKSILENNFTDGYIMNHKIFFKTIKDIIL